LEIQQLINVLEEQVKVYRHLLEVVRKEKDILISANLDDLNEEDDDQFDDDGEVNTPKNRSGVYVPPKVAATEYLDEETPEKRVEKARKKTVSHLLIREMQEELLDTPTEIFHGRQGGSGSGQVSRGARDKQSYEEKYMTRLPETKKDKQATRAMTTLGMLGDEITNFRPPSSGGSSGKKRKMKKGKGSKGGGGKKKKMRKK